MMDGNRMCGADDKNSCILYICCSKSRFRYAVNLKTKISRLLLVEHKEFEKCRIGVLGTSLPSVSKSSDQRAPNIAGIFQASSDVTSLEYRKTLAEKKHCHSQFYASGNNVTRFCKCYVPNDTPSWQQHTQGSGHSKAKSEHLRKLGRLVGGREDTQNLLSMP